MAVVFHFSDLELDLRRYELRRNGQVLKLERIPMDLLVFLVEQRGRLVTREEIIERIWGKDVFVDTENAINTAVRKLRQALKDDPTKPRTLETVPGRGYRFVAAVAVQDEMKTVAPHVVSPAPSAAQTAVVAALALESPAPAKIAKPQTRRWQKLIALPLALATLVLAYLFRPIAAPPRVTHVLQLTRSREAFGLGGLLTDGPRIYYLGFNGTKWHVKQVLLNGNEDTVVPGLLPNVPNVLYDSLTLDSTEFLVHTRSEAAEDGPVWVVPVSGGEPRRIGNLVAHAVSCSHDGTRLAFARGAQIFLANRDGTDVRLLATLEQWVVGPRWSPDDQRLAFTVQTALKPSAIWEIGVDGRDLHKLDLKLAGVQKQCCGDWTPDGRYFVFAVRRDDNWSLWARREKSHWFYRSNPEPVQLTVGPVNYYAPLPSRDGKKIFAVGSQPSGELLRYDLKRKEFVPFLGGLSADHLEFTKDGQWVTYVRYPEGTLWRGRSDGSQQLQLTFSPLFVLGPHWSPDGKQIVFSARRPGETYKIYTISTDGGTATPVLFEPYWQREPVWLPGGDALLYVRGADFEDYSDPAIYRLELQTGHTEKLGDGLCHPIPSPDGRYLAVIGDRNQLFLFDIKTGQRKRLSQRRADYPNWSSDSSYVYFNTLYSPEPALFRVRVDGKEEKITDVRFGSAGLYGPSGAGLAPDGSPLILRGVSNNEIYALSVSFP